MTDYGYELFIEVVCVYEDWIWKLFEELDLDEIDGLNWMFGRLKYLFDDKLNY